MSHENPEELLKPKNFRDRVATIDEKGGRVWLYPRKPKGRFYQARSYVSWLLLLILFGLPFLKIDGRSAVLMNVLERKFFFFGLVFWPQDFHIFALSFITFFVFIILFTVIFGRLFCGWACPQTIFMEMIFRKIEYWIEGDSHKQRALNKAPWTTGKILKKTVKHILFFGISFIIGNTFLAYIIGIDELQAIVTNPIQTHLSGFIAMLIFSFVFYGVFSWFREQVCTMVCPYGRLQSVLLDHNSIVVSYDFKRGEPRGIPQKTPQPLGDCIDCGLCVEVCPTGIDIRNGTQLECVNCTACIDACDGVMQKLKRPLGLIRYASYNAIDLGDNRHFTPRALGYTAVLLALFALVTVLFLQRSSIETTILHMPGTVYQEMEDEKIQNVFNVEVINKSFDEHKITFKIKNQPQAEFKLISGKTELILKPNDIVRTVMFVKIPEHQLHAATEALEIETHTDGKLADTFSTKFKTPHDVHDVQD